MPRRPKPSETVVRHTLDLALFHGKENLAVIYRSLAVRLERLRQEEGLAEETPDVRTIKWIVNDYINELPLEVVKATFPKHVWILRKDYSDLTSTHWPVEKPTEVEIQTLCRHFEDLSRLGKQWRAQILAPPFQLIGLFPCLNDIRNEALSLVPGMKGRVEAKLSVENDALFDCLKEHLQDSPIWELFRTWKSAIEELVFVLEKMCDYVRDSPALAQEQHIRQGDWDRGIGGITRQFIKAIVADGCAASTGELPIWGELWRITASKSHYDEIENYQKLSLSARQQVTGSSLMQQFQEIHKQVQQTEKELRACLITIERITGFLGKCRLCPH